MDLLREKLRARGLHRVLQDATADAPDVGTMGGNVFGETPPSDPAEAAFAEGAFAGGGGLGTTGLTNPSFFGLFANEAPDIGTFGGDVFGETQPGPPAEQAFAESQMTGGEGSFGQTLANLITSKGGRAALAALGKAMPALAPVISIANMAAQGQQGKSVGGFLGGLGTVVGGALGGPLGAMAGGTLGSMAGQMAGNVPGVTGAAPSNVGAEGDREMAFDLAGTAAGLGGLYSARQAGKELGQQASTLANLYGPDSPYAQALRQQLARADAASGRRSQYGPREVELQAQLAGLASRNAPQTMAAQQAARAQKNAQINTLLGLGKRTGAFDWAQRQLSDLWTGGGAPVDMTGFQTPLEAPVYGDFAQMAPTAQFDTLGTGTYGLSDYFTSF